MDTDWSFFMPDNYTVVETVSPLQKRFVGCAKSRASALVLWRQPGKHCLAAVTACIFFMRVNQWVWGESWGTVR